MNTTLLLTAVVFLLGLALLVSAYLLRAQRSELAKLRVDSERLYWVRATLDRLRPSWRDTDSTEAGGVETVAMMRVMSTDELLEVLERVVPPWRSRELTHARRVVLQDETFRTLKTELEQVATDLREPAPTTEENQAP